MSLFAKGHQSVHQANRNGKGRKPPTTQWIVKHREWSAEIEE